MSSRGEKTFQFIETRTNGRKGSLYLSWPSDPLLTYPSESSIPLQFPLQVPNLDRSLKHPLSLFESTYYLLAPKEREERKWRPWITRVEKVDPTTWRVLSPLIGMDNLVRSVPSILGELGKPSNYLIKELAKSYTLFDDSDPNKRELKADKVLALFEQGHLQLLALRRGGKLASWKQGDETWTDIIPEDGGYFIDIATYNGRFYAIACFEGLYTIDDNQGRLIRKASDHESNDIINHCPAYGWSGVCSKFMVFDGLLCIFDGLEVLRVVQGSTKENAVATIEIDQGEDTWEIIKSLKNKILFKIGDVSFCLPAYLLDRKFQGDWICSCDGDGHNCEDGDVYIDTFPSPENEGIVES